MHTHRSTLLHSEDSLEDGLLQLRMKLTRLIIPAVPTSLCGYSVKMGGIKLSGKKYEVWGKTTGVPRPTPPLATKLQLATILTLNK